MMTQHELQSDRPIIPLFFRYPLLFAVVVVWVSFVTPTLAQTDKEIIAVFPRDFPPHYIVTPNQEPTGFAIDVMNALAKRSGLKVRYRVKDTWMDVHDALKSGEADVVPNMGITEQRRASFDFTSPVETLPVSIFIRTDTQGIEGVEDLQGRKVAVVATNIAVRLLEKRKGIELVNFAKIQTALFALLSGEVDAFAFPQGVTEELSRRARIDHQIRVVGEPLIEIKRAVAVRKGSKALYNTLEASVQEFVHTQEYRDIYAKWYAKPVPFWTSARVTWTLSMVSIAMLVAAAFLIKLTSTNRKLQREVTLREAAEQELIRHSDKLEDLVVERSTEIMKSAERYRSLYIDTPAMLHSVDQDMHIIQVSDYWLSHLGYTRDQVIGRKITDFQTEASRHAAVSNFPTFMKSGTVKDLALQFIKSNGEVIDVSLASIRTLSAQGEFGHSMSVMFDVTEEKQAKAALHKALESEKEFTALQRKFISLVSHEFRTPLTIIDGTAQRLVRAKTALSPAILQEKSDMIRSAVVRMTDLIENTLYAARLEEGVVKIHPEAIDLGAMLCNFAVLHSEISPLHDIHIDVKGLPSTLLGDEEMLSIVFTNLISNAVKFSPKSQKIEIKGWREGGEAVVSVMDQGVGIPKEELPHMFKRFFRAKTAEGIKGTGIGLNVCFEFVEMHGGTIVVDSAEGEGSTFVVRLPVNVKSE